MGKTLLSYILDSDATMTMVNLVAEDANDEQPVFVNSTLFAAVAEEAPFGSSVTRLQVCCHSQY